MITFELPVTEHLGVVVRAGYNGAVVPALCGGVYVGGVRQDGTQMQVRYPVTRKNVQLHISMLDLARIAPRGANIYLTATVYELNKVVEHHLGPIFVDIDAPDGLVWALITRDGTYFSTEGLEPQTALTVLCEDGHSYTTTVMESALFVNGETATPINVTATDSEGLSSGNILAGVEIEPESLDEYTALSAWPLPPYLDPKRPNLSAMLNAFGDALDVRPEYAGHSMYVKMSTSDPLTLIGKLYGVSRTSAPDDSAMQRRISATLTADKPSLNGLNSMLHAYGIFGGEVQDAYSLSSGNLLVLDGSWLLNGEYRLDGGVPGDEIAAGEVLATFSRVPINGLESAVEVMRRFKSAGIRSRVRLRRHWYAELPHPGTRTTLWRICICPLLKTKTPFLVLDGSWQLDGHQTLDGVQ